MNRNRESRIGGSVGCILVRLGPALARRTIRRALRNMRNVRNPFRTRERDERLIPDATYKASYSKKEVGFFINLLRSKIPVRAVTVQQWRIRRSGRPVAAVAAT